MKKTICLHCKRTARNFARGLCQRCHADLSIRNLYPADESRKRQDITGQKFGRLTAMAFSHIGKNKQRVWRCICDCGNESFVSINTLRYGASQSCGCLRSELRAKKNKTHGMKGTPEYRRWQEMKTRCMNPNRDPAYFGLYIYPEWIESFELFYEHIGPMPSGRMTVDRIQNNKGYEPGNVRWATITQQARNRTNNRLVTMNGETRCVSEWIEKLGLQEHRSLVYGRLRRGLPLEKVFYKGSLSNNLYNRSPEATERRKLSVRNTSRNHYITFDGQRLCLSEWSERTGIGARTISLRLARGWTPQQALTTPRGQRRT